MKKRAISEVSIILLGACIIGMLALSSYYINQKTQKSNFSRFESVTQKNLKYESLLLNMTNVIRDRLLLVYQINLSTDPFEIDELNLEFTSIANEYVRSRQQLLDLGLPKEQLKQLDKLRKTLIVSRQSLEDVINIKLNNESEIFVNSLAPANEANKRVLNEIQKLIDNQLRYAQASLEDVRQSNIEANFLTGIFNAFALLVSLLTIIYIIKTLKLRQNLLNRAINDLEDHNKNLESTVSERTSDLLQLQKKNSEINAVIEINRQLQRFISPSYKELKQYKNIDIATYVESAEEVGGDYVDVLPFHEGQLICIGDVTDHGLKSSITMLMIQSIIRHQSNTANHDIKQALIDINLSLFQNIQRMKSDRHLSLSLLHLKDNTLTVTGQHETIVIVRDNGTIEKISTDELGFYVGFIEDIEEFVNSIDITLQKNDLVLLHTDGITEAANANEELYGFDRLCEQAQKLKDQSAYDIVHTIIGDMNKFVGAKALYDDVALIVFKQI